MRTLLQDLKYGIRVFASKPGFTIVALLALILGIGANSALFSILYAVFWKPLPYKDADRLVIVWERSQRQNMNVANPANFMDWKEQNNVFEDMASFAQTGSTNLTGGNIPEQVPVQYSNPNLFKVLGTRPALGRDFLPTDGQGDDIVVILSHNLWVRRYGADPSIVGKDILTNSRKARVVGVMPKNWNWFVKEGSIFGKPPELWIAFPITNEMRTRRGRYLTTVARLKPGVTLKQAQANMDLLAAKFAKQYPEFNTNWGVNVVPIRDQFSGKLRKPLWVLSGAVLFVLLIACTNVANLMLARALARGREMAVRSALGAHKRRLIRQLLTESVLLSVVGGIAGLFLAIWGTEALALLGQRAGIDFGSIKLNLPVVAFSLGISVLTGLIFGIAPALIASKWNLSEQLKEGSRGTSGQEVGALRNALVVVQLTIALVLLAGATLLIQSFSKLTSIDPGFDAKSVLTFRLVLPSLKYPEHPQRFEFFRKVVERLGALPGTKSVGITSYLPFGGPSAGTGFTIEGQPDPPPGQDRVTNVFVVDDGFFRTLQVPLMQGRTFTRTEVNQRKDVVLINETLAKLYFPGQDPIGKRITIDMRDENVPSTIIGIVGDMKQQQLDESILAAVYWPYPELPYTFMTVVMRTETDPMDSAPAAVATIHEIDRDQPLAELTTLEERLGDSTARAQFNMVLLVLLAGVALTLAAAGLYGIMSHAVQQRTREMGIRMALGASSGDVFKLVLKEGSRILILGSLIGCAATLVLTRVMQSMLYDTDTSNPLTFVIVMGVLLLTGLIACWVPSKRAARVHPMEALHYE